MVCRHIEFRQKVVELARSGRRLDELAHEFDLALQTVRNWVKQHELDAGTRSDGLTTEERAELSKLKREVKRLTIENEILSKAAAWVERITSPYVDPKTGEPTLVQNIDTHGKVPRTFALDPSARILVAANELGGLVRDGGKVVNVHENLALFKVRPDGKLDFVRAYPVDDIPGIGLFWMGINPLPQ
jgi:transposase